MSLETLLRDKITQHGQGGANQFRKAFKVLDKDLNGQVTVPEFREFLERAHININPHTMQRFFDKWTGSTNVPHISYNQFIGTILPPDYPERENMLVADVASLARDKGAKTVLTVEMSKHRNVESWEQDFRDKLQQRSISERDRTRLFKRFDRTKKGHTTFADLLHAAETWNVTCTPEVEVLLRSRYVRPENASSGKIEYYDYINKVLPADFKDPAEVMAAFRKKMEANFEHLQNAFLDTDRDSSGTITLVELMDEMTRIGITSNEAILRRVLSKFDVDGDGRVDFDEFSHALTQMEPGDFLGDDDTAVSHQVKMLWDPDDETEKRRAKIGRPPSVGSIHSLSSGFDQDEMDLQLQWSTQATDIHKGENVYLDENDGRFVREGGSVIDIVDILCDKMYRKRGGVSEMRRAFHRFDPDGNGKISCYEFSLFLRPFNLNLSPRALQQLVRTFDLDGDGYIGE